MSARRNKPSPEPSLRRSSRSLLPVAAGLVVALAVLLLARVGAVAPGIYPGGYFRLFFSDPIHLKAWVATAVLVVAVAQPLSAAWIFGKLPWHRPSWIAAFHRWNGRLVLLLTLPVAYLCIFRFGFQTTTGRVIAHGLLGAALYGAFTAKILTVRLHRPALATLVAGGLLFSLLIAVWSTSALWLFEVGGVRR